MLITLILGNNNITCLMVLSGWGPCFCIWATGFDMTVLGIPRQFVKQGIGKFFGQHDKNVAKIPIFTPWKVIGTSDEGGWGVAGVLKRQFFLKTILNCTGKTFPKG